MVSFVVFQYKGKKTRVYIFFSFSELRSKSGASVALRLHNSTCTTGADKLSKLTMSLLFSPVCLWLCLAAVHGK